MGEGLSPLPPEELGRITEAQEAHEKRRQIEADQRNRSRSLFDRLRGKNVVTSVDIAHEEALEEARQRVQDVGDESQSDTQTELESLEDNLDALLSENKFQEAAALTSMLLQEKHAEASEQAPRIIKQKINELIQDNRGQELLMLYRALKSSMGHIPEGAENNVLEVALEKYARLTNPDFTQFGIRFVNLGEYEEIMAGGRFTHHEVYNIGAQLSAFRDENGNTPCLTEYMQTASLDWKYISEIQTQWRHSSSAINIHRNMLRMLNKARSSVPIAEEPRRVAIMKKFVEMVVDLYGKRPGASPAIGAAAYLVSHNGEMNERVKQNIQICGEENIQRIKDFLESPDKLAEGDNLRLFMNAVVYSDNGLPPEGRYFLDSNKPYHLAIIIPIDEQTIANNTNRDTTWPGIDIENATVGHSLLGTISLISDRTLDEQVVRMASQDTAKAHVVFDSHGHGRFPNSDVIMHDLGFVDSEPN